MSGDKYKFLYMKRSKARYIFVGFIGTAILLASYWGFNYLKGTDLFKSTHTYYVHYNRIDGLNTSAPVTVSGFKVGQVDRIELAPESPGLILVSISVLKEVKIPVNSVARIYSMDLMGSKGIELLFSDSTEHHTPHEFFIADIEKSLKEEVNYQFLPLKHQAEDLMAELQRVIEIITYIFNPETRDNLDQSFESIKNTFLHLESSAVTLDTIMAAQSKRINTILKNVASISDNLRKSNAQITNIINNFSEISDSLIVADISTTIAQATEAIDNFNEVAYKLNKGEGTLGALIHDDQLYYDLDNAATSLDKLLTDLRLNPGKYVNFSLMNFGRTIHVSDESELSKRDLRRLERQRQSEEEIRQKNLEKEREKDQNDNESEPEIKSEIINTEFNGLENTGQVYFMIQIKSGLNRMDISSPGFKNYTDITEIFVDDYYKYLTALHYDSENTYLYLSIIREDFPDAFPIAFRGMQMISYTEAIDRYK